VTDCGNQKAIARGGRFEQEPGLGYPGIRPL